MVLNHRSTALHFFTHIHNIWDKIWIAYKYYCVQSTVLGEDCWSFLAAQTWNNHTEIVFLNTAWHMA